MGILAWLVVGLIAGWLASQVIRGGGYGLIGDIIVGIVGALIAWVLVKIVWLVMGDSRRGVRTTSSQLDTRVR